jgi:hypothetical protein
MVGKTGKQLEKMLDSLIKWRYKKSITGRIEFTKDHESWRNMNVNIYRQKPFFDDDVMIQSYLLFRLIQQL